MKQGERGRSVGQLNVDIDAHRERAIALLVADQVARRLGVTTDTLARWRRLGKGPRFTKFGRGRSAIIRYRPEDVEAFVEASLQSSTSETASS